MFKIVAIELFIMLICVFYMKSSKTLLLMYEKHLKWLSSCGSIANLDLRIVK